MYEDTIKRQVEEYKIATQALATIDEVDELLSREFVAEFATIKKLEDCIKKRREELLVERGVRQEAKRFEAAQKQARKMLYQPVRLQVQHPIEIDGAIITVVNQKPVVVQHDSWNLTMHKHDVQLLIDNNMWASIDIVKDASTVSFMDLREQNEMENLQSVVVVEQGYCKVALK